jgi:hypothetical protein
MEIFEKAVRLATTVKRPARDPKVYVLTIEAAKGSWRTPPIQRLRGLLKTMLRAWGFRCTNIATRDEPGS